MRLPGVFFTKVESPRVMVRAWVGAPSVSRPVVLGAVYAAPFWVGVAEPLVELFFSVVIGTILFVGVLQVPVGCGLPY